MTVPKLFVPLNWRALISQRYAFIGFVPHWKNMSDRSESDILLRSIVIAEGGCSPESMRTPCQAHKGVQSGSGSGQVCGTCTPSTASFNASSRTKSRASPMVSLLPRPRLEPSHFTRYLRCPPSLPTRAGHCWAPPSSQFQTAATLRCGCSDSAPLQTGTVSGTSSRKTGSLCTPQPLSPL